jgi:DNA recombination-mediator protein A
VAKAAGAVAGRIELSPSLRDRRVVRS